MFHNRSKTLSEYLKSRMCKEFKPGPIYSPHDDSITIFFVDDKAYAAQLSPELTVYFSMQTGQIVGCKVIGVDELKRKYNEVREGYRCEHQWVGVRNETVDGGMVCMKCKVLKTATE